MGIFGLHAFKDCVFVIQEYGAYAAIGSYADVPLTFVLDISGGVYDIYLLFEGKSLQSDHFAAPLGSPLVDVLAVMCGIYQGFLKNELQY